MVGNSAVVTVNVTRFKFNKRKVFTQQKHHVWEHKEMWSFQQHLLLCKNHQPVQANPMQSKIILSKIYHL